MEKKCIPCEAAGTPLGLSECMQKTASLQGWNVIDDGGILKLTKRYYLPDYRSTVARVNAIAELSEAEGHHPVMLVEFRSLTLWWWTHKIGGLHENDFIMAEACDTLAAAV